MDKQGEIVSWRHDNGASIEVWSGVAGLDCGSSALRAAMISAMRFWVREADIVTVVVNLSGEPRSVRLAAAEPRALGAWGHAIDAP